MADKDELYALSHRTGATDRDSAVDIDGGFGTVLSYASKAKRELPDDTIVLDGAVEPLGKRGTFAGQHVYTPLRGVAVQINAFNFPVWGFLEKLAPAFLAGVPTIVKPASQTAYLTEAVVRKIIESGLLPEGALQLLSGSASGVLDQLAGQDLVSFTGSASTAASCAAHRRSSELRALQRRGGFAELLGARAGRHAGHPGVRSVRRAIVTEMTTRPARSAPPSAARSSRGR